MDKEGCFNFSGHDQTHIGGEDGQSGKKGSRQYILFVLPAIKILLLI
jgi:hypothetical protein